MGRAKRRDVDIQKCLAEPSSEERRISRARMVARQAARES
jgi:hypothetical protein